MIIMKQKEEWSNISPRISFRSFVRFCTLMTRWYGKKDDDNNDYYETERGVVQYISQDLISVICQLSRLYFVWLFDHYDDDDGDEDLLGGIMGIEAGYTNVAIWGTSFLGTWLLTPSIYFMALSFYPPWLKLKEADICNSWDVFCVKLQIVLQALQECLVMIIWGKSHPERGVVPIYLPGSHFSQL